MVRVSIVDASMGIGNFPDGGWVDRRATRIVPSRNE